MKKLKFLSIALAVLFLGSCSKFVEDYDVSPNDPSEVTPSLLLANAELATFAIYHGQLARTANLMTQHLTGTDFQMVEYGNYVILEGDVQNEWRLLYSNVIVTCNTLLSDHSAGNPYYSGMAKTLKAMALGVATDLWGDVPASEASNGIGGSEFYNAKYDNQEDVLKMIQSLLSDAIVDFGATPESNTLLPGSDDIIAGGDADAWKKAAYMLKARYAMHLTKRDEAGATTAALAALNDAGLTDNSDDFMATYGSAGNELNPYDAFESSRGGYIRMGGTLVDMMNGMSDPRVAIYCAKDTGGNYSGTPVGSIDNVTSPIGSYLRGTSMDIISFVEAKFIEAEAHFRKGNLPEAADAHNDAVKASIEKVTGGADATYEAAYASETSSSITLDKIMTQKYVAMFGQIEVWADWRRTNIPALTPNPKSQLSSIPRRMPSSLEERLYNTNARTVTDITKPVWWDE
jgi:hypothetical protein